jgi:hypothetical protein
VAICAWIIVRAAPGILSASFVTDKCNNVDNEWKQYQYCNPLYAFGRRFNLMYAEAVLQGYGTPQSITRDI